MNIRQTFLGSLIGLGAVTGVSAAEAAPTDNDAKDNDCVFFRSVYDWKALDKTHLIVWAPGRKDAYLVETTMPLNDLKWSEQVAFVDSDRNGMLCGHGMDRIVVPSSTFTERATITSMRRVDQAELQQLGEQYKVKLGGKKTIPAEPVRQSSQ